MLISMKVIKLTSLYIFPLQHAHCSLRRTIDEEIS